MTVLGEFLFPISGLPSEATTLTGNPGTPWTTGSMWNGLRTGGMRLNFPGWMSSGEDIDRPYWAWQTLSDEGQKTTSKLVGSMKSDWFGDEAAWRTDLELTLQLLLDPLSDMGKGDLALPQCRTHIQVQPGGRPETVPEESKVCEQHCKSCFIFEFMVKKWEKKSAQYHILSVGGGGMLMARVPESSRTSTLSIRGMLDTSAIFFLMNSFSVAFWKYLDFAILSTNLKIFRLVLPPVCLSGWQAQCDKWNQKMMISNVSVVLWVHLMYLFRQARWMSYI